jgi:hypothetical protein
MNAVRRAAALLAIAAAILVVPALALAHGNGSKPKVHNCGQVQGTVAVTVQGNVSCKAAKKIANTWLNKKKQTTGFACHRKKSNGGSGFQGVCAKGTKRVFIIPE